LSPDEAGIGQRPMALTNTNPSGYGTGEEGERADARRPSHGELKLDDGNGDYDDSAFALARR
jgi:hypothetical protein